MVRGDEVQPDAADSERGEEDMWGLLSGRCGGGRERGHSGVAGGRAHGAVDACEDHVARGEGGLDDVEEGGPLAEDDGFGARIFGMRGVEDVEEEIELATAAAIAGFVAVGGIEEGVGGFTEVDGGMDEGID